MVDLDLKLMAAGLAMPSDRDREEDAVAYARAYLAEAEKQGARPNPLAVPWVRSVHARACDRVANFYQSHCFCGRRVSPTSSLCEGHDEMACLEMELKAIHSNPIEWAIASPELLDRVRGLRKSYGPLRRGY